ncbi:monooxygenase FAD-binding protein [Kribbella flavida DSM 17836]|uniref:Monooxygenase FAD-binding protein n=1 Tax=Kribbella flavida (strain DSM 17836 / JCM 10339 / NBRC 14399) TaxID=479435 RepID=D2Q0X2_KRIFD|nr:FAD-dependent monooxygenase [Kribbella flavida]ADB35673.1 monooxygenase FAD-binding protein [Kribbella flavida DSM 17836]
MRTAIVVGAGIGGAAAALGLERSGWQVTVLERAPELGEVGAGISVWPSAVAALAELGVTEVQQAVALVGPAGMRRPDGGWVVEATALGMEAPVMIHRARLHALITERFGPEVAIRTGVTVTGVSQNPAGAEVVAGDEVFRADLVVAADGLRSVVRQTLHPQYAGPRYSGYTAYRGIADVELTDGGGETWGRGRRFGFARLIDGRFYWYATANRPAAQVVADPHADVLEAFGSWHEPIPALLAGTPPESVLQNDIYDLTLPLVPFVSGRVALLGDAAHAMTPNLGRGACTALEDAATLARHLKSPDWAAALAAYDAERRPAATKLVRASRGIGWVGQLDHQVACAVRDGMLAVGGKLAGVTARRRRVGQSRT